jgi:50S ribosomal protein L16 3-hydroxylase
MPSVNAATKILLGDQTPGRFLRRFWQKEAHLVRGALPGFTGIFTREQLFVLAGRDDVESRLVLRNRGRWTLDHGPFRGTRLNALPATGWTLLVQGANLHSDAADALLRRFAFLPYARLDDLMVSFAAPGGGVGAHYDSYDVFLLQGEGRRRWRYGRQNDLTLKPGLPVKILRRFAPQHDAVLASGDMLYLPPSYAHDGVAVDACVTYSIGFRAASHNEIAQAFLDHLRDELELDGRYADPDLKPSAEPARIGKAMQNRIGIVLRGIQWNRATSARFLGAFLSDPKPDVYFTPPSKRQSRAAFAKAIARHGVTLDRRTQWLYDDDSIYLNGEAMEWPADSRPALVALANARTLTARQTASLSPATLQFLHDGYSHGFLHIA